MRRESPVRQLATVLLSLGSLALVVSCSGGLQQDPLSGQPEEIRRAQAPGLQKPKPTATPIREEALRIDTDNYFSFKEGEEGEFKINGRFLMPIVDQTTGAQRDAEMGKDLILTIENMNDFPGVSFDKTTGRLKWTPPVGYVKDLYTRNNSMYLTLSKIEPPIYTRRMKVPVYVTRKESDPDIIDIEDITTTPILEGSSGRTFRVTVWDPDSENFLNMRPRLLVLTGSSYSSAAHLIRVTGEPTQDPMNAKRWNFSLSVTPGAQEITRDKSFLNFGLTAVSRFGRSSAPKTGRIVFVTNVSKPVISWTTDEMKVTGGEKVALTFNVADLKAEGVLSTTFQGCMTSNRTCDCKVGSDKSNLVCSVMWDVPNVAFPTSDSFVIVAENKHPDAAINLKETVSRKVFFRVNPGPTPVPTPVPTPAPQPAPTPVPMPIPPSPPVMPESGGPL